MKLTELKLKYTNRSIMIFEAITGKAFNITSLTDQYLFFYSILLANNKDVFEITFDDFIDLLDDQPEAMVHFGEWLTCAIKMNNQFTEKKTPKGKQ